ncbi:MAG: hypothetical protein GX605_11435 [Chloroflexi bacterium]|nr:hypothetical protein [Chloroflexota bacterium]
MNGERGKIITSLRHRLRIEAALREMLEAPTASEFEAMAQRIARQGAQVVPVLVANLGTSDQRFRAALGAVASHLAHEEISYALREVVMEPGRSDQERATALMILERFLDEEIGDDLYLELVDPLEVARQSLREAAVGAESDRQVYVEYLRSLEQETTEVALLVLQAAETMEPATVVEPLRLLALDPRSEVASEALRILGTIRMPTAVQALESLAPCLPQERRPWAQRAQRKLLMAGVPAQPKTPLEEHCRLLVSPADDQGNFSIWVLEVVHPDRVVNLVTVMLDMAQGITECVGVPALAEMPLQWAPQVGAVHRLSLPWRGEALMLLEAEPAYAVRWMEEGVAQALAQAGCLPWGYRVWGHSIWGYDLPQPTPQPQADLSPERAQALLAQSGQLLAHPAFDAWPSGGHGAAALLSGWHGTGAPSQRTAAGAELVKRFVEGHWDAQHLESTRRSLLANSEWLRLAGAGGLAELALAAALGLSIEGRGEHPLLTALAERALALAWEESRQKSATDRRPKDELARANPGEKSTTPLEEVSS